MNMFIPSKRFLSFSLGFPSIFLVLVHINNNGDYRDFEDMGRQHS